MPKKKNEEELKVDTGAITKEVMAYVDTQLDQRLEKVVNDSIRKNIIEEIEKANKKVIRMKNRKIFVKNILLIILLCIIMVLLYLLYDNHFFDSYVPSSENSSLVLKEDKEENYEPSLDELKEEYASYLDSYSLSDQSPYLESFYEGDLTIELKNYFSLLQLDFNQLKVEDDYQSIDASSLKKICSSLFEGECDNKSFDYNGNKVRYFKKLDSYITDYVLEREDSKIQREIIDIQVDQKIVHITTIEAIVEDGQIFSVYPYEYIDEYEGEGFENYQESLNKVIYTFEDHKLVSVEKG